jgi:hypothetical protein
MNLVQEEEQNKEDPTQKECLQKNVKQIKQR